MRRAAIAISIAVALACGGRRRAWQPIAEPSASPGAYALVQTGAPLFALPDARAQSIALDPGGVGFAPYRVIGERRGWVELETIGEHGEGHCAPELRTLRGLRLRLFAPSQALATIVAREIRQRFPDGTSIELRRGVPAQAAPERGAYRVAHDGVTAQIELQPGDVGTRYLPSEPFGAPPRLDATLSVDALVAAVPILGRSGRVQAGTARAIRAVQTNGAERIVELTTPCMRLVLRVPAQVVQEGAPPNPPVAEDEPGPPFVDRGAELTWRDGRSAGVAVTRASIGPEIDPAGDRRCFRLADLAEEIAICARRADVLDSRPGAADLLDPP